MPARADPAAHFKISNITVAICESQFVIPGRPASWWLSILTEEDPELAEIFPWSLRNEDQVRIEELLLSGKLLTDELRATIYDILTVASGHPWWWTMKLLSVLSGSNGTQLLGELAHLDPDRMPFSAWVNALYARLVKYAKEEDKAKLDMDLDTPPPELDIDPSEMIDEDEATNAFFGMMNQANK